MGEPAILKTQAHFEQPQPQKSGRSIHTNSRRIASRAHLLLARLGFVKDGTASVFTATTKPLFQCLERGWAQATPLRQTKPSWILTIEKCAVCGVSNKRQELLSQSEVVLELLNYGVAFTGGFFEFPAICNIHRATHVL
jgi:hypothetical protein